MKKIIIALLLTASTAMAQDVAYMANKAGGKIIFTDSHCNQGGKIVYSNIQTGRTIHGCWYYNKPDEYIRVVWSDGELYQYPLNALSMTEYGEATYITGNHH